MSEENFVPEVEGEDTSVPKGELTVEQVYALIAEGKTVENARIRKLKFRGNYDKPIAFRNCTLVQPEFNGATFAAEVKFVGCTIDRPMFNKLVTFENNLNFSGSTFNKAIFYRVTVKGEFSASGTQFKNKLGFKGCHFHKKATFWEAKFHGWAEFTECKFQSHANFRSLHADQGFVLVKCQFQGDFLFRGSSVSKKFALDGSRFEALLDISKAKFQDFAYLEQIEAGTMMRLACQNAIGERILIQPKQIEGRLLSEETGNHEQAMQEYGLLKKCYSTQHRYDQEDWAFYRFKMNQRRARPASWSRPWTKWRSFGEWLFLDIGCGYGTNPIRAVRMAFVIILSFAIVYALGVDQFYAEKKPFPDEDVSSWANRTMIGLTTSVSVFTSGMGGIREVAKGWMNIPVMIESVMGTLLFGLFIVAFSRKVIR